MNLGITARARAMAKDGATAAEITLALSDCNPSAVHVAIKRLRSRGELPRPRFKHAAVVLPLSPSMTDSVRRLCADRDLSAHRVAHLALVAGLALMEARR